MAKLVFFFFFYSTLVASRVFKAPLVSRKRDTWGNIEKEGEFTQLLRDTSLPFGLVLPSSFVPNSSWLVEV
jgi:hypothetical protein